MQGVREAFATAVRLHQSGRLAEAERLYRQILQADPRQCDALHMLGVLAMQGGQNQAAVELIRQAIALNERVPAFHNNLGNALKGWGKPQEALAAFGEALRCAPDHAGAHYNLAVTLGDLGRVEEARQSYRRALAVQPAHAEALQNLGNIAAASGKMDEALAAYRRSVAVRPNQPDALCNLGNALILRGRNDEAAFWFEQVLAIQPGHGKSLCGLGIIKLRLSRIAEAASFCRRALVSEPGFANSYVTLGTALGETEDHAEAAYACQRAALLEPGSGEAQLALAICAIPLAPSTEQESLAASDHFLEALERLESWDAAHPGRLGDAIGTSQPFHLAYRPQDVTRLLIRYGALASRAISTVRRAPSWQRRTAGRIRLGIVSGHVRAHPVWDILLKGVVAHLDRDRFEICLYHTGQTCDAETEWARGKAEHFVQGPMPVKSWLDRIADDRPDILFYPEIGMDPVGGALAALRLAPVQAASWGHPVTSGLPTIDLYFSGDLLEGKEADLHYREKLIRLPGTGVCTEPAPIAVRAWEGAGQGVRKFALCQQPLKFDPVHDRLLARIAKQSGHCEFWLAKSKTHPWASERLMARLSAAFSAEGLVPGRHLRLCSWMDRDEFNGFLDAMDVMLDCPAFSGYTTAWQAIHRGLPIVTLEGEFLRQRLAAGLLRQIGQTDGVCRSEDDYVEAALKPHQRIAPEVAQLANGNRAAVDAFAESLISAPS